MPPRSISLRSTTFPPQPSAGFPAPPASHCPPRARPWPWPVCSTPGRAAIRPTYLFPSPPPRAEWLSGKIFSAARGPGTAIAGSARWPATCPSSRSSTCSRRSGFRPLGHYGERLRQRRERRRARGGDDRHRRRRLRPRGRLRGADRAGLRRLRLPPGDHDRKMPSLRPEPLRASPRRSGRLPRPRIGRARAGTGRRAALPGERLRPQHRFFPPHPAAARRPRPCGKSWTGPHGRHRSRRTRSATATPTAPPRRSTTAPKPGPTPPFSTARSPRPASARPRRPSATPSARRLGRGALRHPGPAHRPAAAAAQSANPIPEIAPALVKISEPVRDLRHALSVNLGFGGSNAALLFSRHET